MIKYLTTDPWRIIEKGFDANRQRSSESIFSIGNGRFGQRANHEEKYTGDSLQGSYVAGVYYPDKTRVGWWKNGYPEYFAKVLNSINWIGIDVLIDGVALDMATAQVANFERVLDMQTGVLSRSFEVSTPNGKLHISAERFCSMANDSTAAIKYTLRSVDFEGELSCTPFLDGDVRNEDTNWEENFWEPVHTFAADTLGVITKTKKTEYEVGAAMCNSFYLNGKELKAVENSTSKTSYVSENFTTAMSRNDEVVLNKIICLNSSLNVEPSQLEKYLTRGAKAASDLGFEALREAHKLKWLEIWKKADIKIEGDDEAQQAIRFNIFQLNQTYTGEDDRLNIGPKGFTGEKYGGSTYWDTEAYCIPFYLSTATPNVARQLLVYRYNQLQKAIENAEKLGFSNGAALYPMVTMTGEECHNEWEITFEEIHRNGAIAFAIKNYINHTGDQKYLAEYGFDVLLGIARFWSQRTTWSEDKKKYVILGVTGPNEYENNVNNNWYTNYIAARCMKYATEAYNYLLVTYPEALAAKIHQWKFDAKTELADWKARSENMHFPKLESTEVFLQQDGFMDKEQLAVSDLTENDRPINQKWSWDRILRSIFIKQADVLQGFYFFEEEFSESEHRANFDFYEPKTVHESSLSPCVHSILAAKLGYEDKAYEMYLRTARLDLDDYNHEAYQGLHITSMAGTWMSIVEGFAGMRVRDHKLSFKAMLPKQWKSYAFKVLFRGALLEVTVNSEGTHVEKLTGDKMPELLVH